MTSTERKLLIEDNICPECSGSLETIDRGVEHDDDSTPYSRCVCDSCDYDAHISDEGEEL